MRLTFVLPLVFCVLFPLSASIVGAEGIDVNRLVNAIYQAEGGEKTAHPYGILQHYKHTTPRQACINTINHALRDWNQQGDFILFLSKRYAPIGVKNDPLLLNRNWYKNVKLFYEREIK